MRAQMPGDDDLADGTCDYITVFIGGQLFGLPVLSVQDVFMPHSITEVPLSNADIAGVLNLRGRIVTAIDMRRRLDLPPRSEEQNSMAVGIEANGESYGLVIDSVGDVLGLDDTTLEQNPANLDPRWAAVAGGVHRLDGRLMVILDVERVLALNPAVAAAA
ncbi:Positive regulator of CheA protein activity (CheW) [hydrothermal vent metagenome]|uniref:Positive regulator of CheA protein activity (CheW) n=1 Tax=hydrothermal vent metagenome TaxID=652676 RepID=A0A3B0TZ26_9ZZZZ